MEDSIRGVVAPSVFHQYGLGSAAKTLSLSSRFGEAQLRLPDGTALFGGRQLSSAAHSIVSGAAAAPAAATARVAVCIVGAPRSLAALNRVRTALLATELPLDYYFVVRAAAEAEGNSKGQTYPRIDEAALADAVGRFSPVLAFERGTASFMRNAQCTVPPSAFSAHDNTTQPSLARVWETFAGVRQCFGRVVEHEAATHVLYRALLRLRPDVIFVRPLPLVGILDHADAARAVALPAGQMSCKTTCVNDHLAFVPRALAAVFFAHPADEYVYCRGWLPSIPHNVSLHRAYWTPGTILRASLARVGARWLSVDVGYTLVRPEGVDCERAGLLSTSRRKVVSRLRCEECEAYVRRHAHSGLRVGTGCARATAA